MLIWIIATDYHYFAVRFSTGQFAGSATKSLIELTLLDTVHVAKNHESSRMLYDENDVRWVLQHAKIVEYHDPLEIGSFTITFMDAGHILGSAFLQVQCKDVSDGIGTIVFSGDIGNYPEDLVMPTETVKQADVVIMESTYGDRAHAKEVPEDVLAEEINAIESNKGTLLIPAFSIERSQELLHMIDHLKKSGKVKEQTMVFLDSVLAIHVTHVYQQYRSLYNPEIQDHIRTDDPFTFPGLSMIERHNESVKIDAFPGPKVIIAGSGMMTGGRILRHAQVYLPLPTTRLLIVGFQAEDTVGRHLLDGDASVMIDGMNVPVKATVRRSSGLSSHADQPKLLAWLSSIKGVSTICLTHGEDGPRNVLAAEIQKKWPHVAVHKPQKGDSLHFGSDQVKTTFYGSSGRKPR